MSKSGDFIDRVGAKKQTRQERRFDQWSIEGGAVLSRVYLGATCLTRGSGDDHPRATRSEETPLDKEIESQVGSHPSVKANTGSRPSCQMA